MRNRYAEFRVDWGKSGFGVMVVGIMSLLFGLMIFALFVTIYSVVWKLTQGRSRRLSRENSRTGRIPITPDAGRIWTGRI